MQLQDQVINLSQAKRLKELGISQQSVACFICDELHLFEKSFYNWAEQKGMNAVAAFTVAELGVMLPVGFDTMRITSEKSINILVWQGYDLDGNDFTREPFNTEAECRAAMLIHHLESKLITPAEVNQRLNS
jgi:hypothetical protein